LKVNFKVAGGDEEERDTVFYNPSQSVATGLGAVELYGRVAYPVPDLYPLTYIQERERERRFDDKRKR
jgi:hypothetical protein